MGTLFSRRSAGARGPERSTMKAKPWQIVVIVAALVIAAVSVALTLRRNDQPKLSEDVMLVDVTTGQLWKAARVGIPATNPETGKQSLVSVYQDQNGRWMTSNREVAVVTTLGVQPTAVDTSTGEVKVTSDKAKRLR
jgi:hypothetical protein